MIYHSVWYAGGADIELLSVAYEDGVADVLVLLSVT